MMTHRLFRVAAFAPCLWSFAVAATPTDCSTADDTQGCFAPQSRVADAQLNTLYQAILKRLDSSARNPKLKTLYLGVRNQLATSERTWRAFRDSDCAMFNAIRGGGAELGIQLLACKLSHTRNRIEDLKGWQQEIWQDAP